MKTLYPNSNRTGHGELGRLVNHRLLTLCAQASGLNWIQQHDALCYKKAEDLLMDEAGIACHGPHADLQSVLYPQS